MKLFLASALSNMKEELLKKVGSLQGKKIAYIINPADNDIAKSPDGENLSWLKRDREMLGSYGAALHKIDLRLIQHKELDETLKTLDGIYVSGGNVYYFRKIANESGFDAILSSIVVNENKFYISTSAGSCAMGTKLKYLDPGREKYHLFDGFGYVPHMIIPHRGTIDFKQQNTQLLEFINNEKQSIITLTDQQALRVTENGIEIVTNQ